VTAAIERTPLVRIRGLGKTFPGQVALAGVDLDIRAGEVHAIVGQNGSGKSTLIKLLAGYHHPDPGGTIEWHGPGAHGGGLGFVHQDLALVETLSAIENIALVRPSATRRGHIDRRGERERACALMERLGREIDLTRPLAELPAVERTLVAMARALDGLGASCVLVLDEPTAALPKPEVARLFAAIEQIRSDGGAVLYVSHRLDEVFAIADLVTVLRDGKRVATREASELDHDGLIELMLGHALHPESKRRSGWRADDVALEVSSLSGGRIQDFSVSVRAGEIVGVAGLIGSGREDIAEALVGFVPATSGVVKVNGKELSRRNPRSAIDAGLALVPADRARHGLILEHTVAENITLPGLKTLVRALHIDRRRERRDAAGWIDRVGLVPPDPNRIVRTLSGGNQQKAVLARWLRARPRVLILDEPTQGVDVAARDAIHGLLNDAASLGLALLICSAEIEEELVELCDRVLVMRGGRVAVELVGAELSANRIARETLAAAGDIDGNAVAA
jgi:ribose transport system ATP-binding protein